MSNARELAELGGSYGQGGFVGMKNRIINGAMMISQRGTSAFTQSTSSVYTLDRWNTYGSSGSQFTVQQLSATPPAGFKNYLGVVNSGTPVTPSGSNEWDVYQYIEGYNIADLGWGAAGASTVTLSFWVRSSVTGTFGASLCNYNSTRTYPFNYTISAANTWEQKSVTIAGDTSGTWYTDNAIGIGVIFSMGAGSSKSGTANTWAGANYTQPTGSVNLVSTASATWQVTGVQLEKGSTATSFDYRPYGTELALCQRYYQTFGGLWNVPASSYITVKFPMTMRGTPSFPFCVAGYGASFAPTVISATNQNDGALMTPNASSTTTIGFYAAASAEL